VEKLFIRSSKEYKDLKEKQVLVLFSETVGGKAVSVALPTG